MEKSSPAGIYRPTTHRMLSFHNAVGKFHDGTDTPRAYLERCIERIEMLGPDRRLLVFGAREGMELKIG